MDKVSVSIRMGSTHSSCWRCFCNASSCFCVFYRAARYGGVTYISSSVLSRGAAWLGIGLLMDGLWGTGTGSTASVEIVGLLAVTKVGSRRVVQMSIGFMFFFSIFEKFGAIVASIPLPIIGDLYCVLFGYMSSVGLGLLQYCNLNSYRTKFILGFSLFMGFFVPQYFNGYIVTAGEGPVRSESIWFNEFMLVIFTSPPIIAAIVSMFLDRTLGYNHKDIRTDGGRHWWGKFKYFERDARSVEFYSLPYGLSKYFPSV